MQQRENQPLSKLQENHAKQPQEEKIFIYPEVFPKRELDSQLREELNSAAELDPVLDAWCIEDSEESSDDVEFRSDTASISSEEEKDHSSSCRGLLEDKTYQSVTEALREVAVSQDFNFEKELRESNLDIYGRVACVNLLRILVYAEHLAVEDTLKRWRDYIQKLRQGAIQLDTHLLQSYFRDDPLLQFAANNCMEDEWMD